MTLQCGVNIIPHCKVVAGVGAICIEVIEPFIRDIGNRYEGARNEKVRRVSVSIIHSIDYQHQLRVNIDIVNPGEEQGSARSSANAIVRSAL